MILDFLTSPMILLLRKFLTIFNHEMIKERRFYISSLITKGARLTLFFDTLTVREIFGALSRPLCLLLLVLNYLNEKLTDS